MRLNFGSIAIDTKGLPAVSSLYVHPPLSEKSPVLVHIALAGDSTRAAVEKWAKRLGVPVARRLRPLYEGDPQPWETEAVAEADGYRVTVFARLTDPAEPAGGVS